MAAPIRCRVNGAEMEHPGEDGAGLLHFLRNVPGLKGTRYEWGAEPCGSCRVEADGK